MTKITERKMGAKFLTSLKVERTDDGQWRLTAPLFYFSKVADTLVHVPAGFVSDFASVPRLPLIYWLTGDSAHLAAVVHDYLYASHMVDRKKADAIFEEASAVAGVPWWRRKLMWLGVRVGGSASWSEA
jgi:hypothetical protein